ncbi:Nramp family divalent metal transporter [Alteromonas sp. ASW11-130]|uniref:Nramp family divalent metal transporter n=1 Tax=Alteromonas sp. ASW11-130 TaxID=3015775 RepID=UPI002242421B|nr:Nramp family divalent metal transporter [Alteromonas sp. ASW11-130]MCW8091720.1 Nramp family divalent metal transporter [Alteromonas sp. ASW11-130]
MKDKSGYIIAAAFIGPGTITTASLAGANYGFHLVWALLFSVIATIVLQDMAARLGLVTGQGLADGITKSISSPLVRKLMAFLIVAAIGIGNAAYESGNLTGAAIGLNALVPLGLSYWVIILGILATVLLYTGRYKLIESTLVSLVFLMAVVFLITLVFARPDFSLMWHQFTSPILSLASLTMIFALIGTTIVPYNLFLHASLMAQLTRNKPPHHTIDDCRKQSVRAIGFGGVITLVVMATAMTTFFGSETSLSAGNLGKQLEPVLGEYAQWFFALGLFAAGLTSAITAPLAAAYAVCGALNRPADLNDRLFRAIWMIVITAGVLVASAGFKPLAAILFAQAANGLLLPIVAVFLLIIMNTHPKLGTFRNQYSSNLVGGAVVMLILVLALYKLAHMVI